VYVAEAAARSLDLFGLQTGLNRRRRCANFSLAFFDPVHFRRQTIDPFTVNCRVIRPHLVIVVRAYIDRGNRRVIFSNRRSVSRHNQHGR
jgi:hypothetical protein